MTTHETKLQQTEYRHHFVLMGIINANAYLNDKWTPLVAADTNVYRHQHSRGLMRSK